MNSDKTIQFVLKLIKLTNNNEVAWDSKIPDSPELPNGEIILDKIYTATILHKRFQLYKYRYKNWRDYDEFEWSERIKLELVDLYGHSEYEFDYDNSMTDLYYSVREHASGVLDIVNEFLGSDLEIIHATYGSSKSVDITEQLRSRILMNSLKVLINNALAGDPDPGKPKNAIVKYKYKGESKEIVVKESFDLILPSENDEKSGW